MSNTSDTYINAASIPHRSCRIAYTLNNEQPVICTIVSDQPFFYLDYEGDIEEDLQDMDFFEDSDFAGSISSASISSVSSASGGAYDDAMRVEEFFANASSICKPADQIIFDDIPVEKNISELEELLSKSRFAQSLIGFAKEFGTQISYSRFVADAEYDRKDAHIRINPNMPWVDQIILLSRELRRVWQHRNGALIDPVSFYPDHAVLVNRAQVCDLTIMMIRMAWELHLADEKFVWDRIESSSMFDMARSFARESRLDFRNLNNGMSASASFETWFLSDRCLKEDRILIQRMLDDNKSCIFEDEKSSFSVAAQLIRSLGSVPFGKNYLAPYIETIVQDAIFSEVRDRSNANFLWFIKFERSFREAEQELQGVDDLNSHDVRHGDQLKIEKLGENEETAQLLILPESGQTSSRQTQNTAQQRQSGDNIISLAGWSSDRRKSRNS